VQYDWGGGLIWALTPAGHDLRAAMTTTAGHATLVRGTGQTFHPDPAPLAAISAALRSKFDPRSILNTGIMG
jgi:glycolate oxidase FAD binding subunit